MEAFTTKGHWWLPEAPENDLDGTLIFDPAGQAKLELSGSFESTGSKHTFAEKTIPSFLALENGAKR